MEKYLSVDTNVFVQCCLLEQEGDDIGALNKLHELLESNSLKLLLTEVVELEFSKKLAEKTSIIQKQIDKYKEDIARDSSLDKKVKKDILEHLDIVIKDRLKNKIEVEKKIEEIFSHRNTIKDGLKITPELLAQSYRYHLNGKKPYKKKDKKIESATNTGVSDSTIINIAIPLQPDCVIIQSLANFLKGRSDYELYFCSLNDGDFAEENNPKDQAKNENPSIHPDIKSIFHHIEYRKNVLNLLNEIFGTKFPEESIKKLEETGATLELNAKDVVGVSDVAEVINTAESEVNTIDIVSKEENNIASS